MIDEAYAMLPRRNGFGADIMQALLDNVTTEEFKGKLVVILSGYKEDIEELFGMNPGFQSRFDKKRIEFLEWDGTAAANAVARAIERDGKQIELDAKDAMVGYFNALRNLPNWASARDAMEWIKPSLEAARADRQFKFNQEKRMLLESESGVKNVRPKTKTLQASHVPPLPYNIEDVKKVFIDAISSRGGEIDLSTGLAIVETAGKLKEISSKMAFEDSLRVSKRQRKVFVVCYTNPRECRPCEEYKPHFEKIAEQNIDVAFAVVDAERGSLVCKMNNILSIPHTVVYAEGRKVDEVLGCDPERLRRVLSLQCTRQSKMNANTLPPQMTERSTDGRGPVAAGPAKAKINELNAVRIRDVEPDDRGSEDDDNLSDESIWAALEDACAELGYSLEKLRDLLDDADNFRKTHLCVTFPIPLYYHCLTCL